MSGHLRSGMNPSFSGAIAADFETLHLAVGAQRLRLRNATSMRLDGDYNCENIFSTRNRQLHQISTSFWSCEVITQVVLEVKSEIRVRVRVGLVPKFSQTAYVGRDHA